MNIIMGPQPGCMRILIQAVEPYVETYDLEGVCWRQMLFTGNCAQI